MANKIAKSFNFGGEDTYILSVDWDAIDGKPEVVNGQDGRGIVRIAKTATNGLVDTYTITYTDGTTSTYTVTNGKIGADGKDGADGADGFSPEVTASPSKNGHTVTIVNKTGTTSFEILDGTDGSDGADGERGHGILKVTTAPTSYTTATGGKNPIKRMALSTIKTQANVDEVLVGDQILHSYYLYNIYYLDASYAYMDAYTSIRGATGAAGAAGKDGYTPVKGVDYYTEADKAEMVTAVKESMEGIPDYWQTELDEGVAEINAAVEAAGRNKSAFLYYTDAHWGYGSGMSPNLLKYLGKHTAINKTIFGGDFGNTYEYPDTGKTMDDWADVMRSWKLAVRDIPNHHSVVGNHDKDVDAFGTDKALYGFLFAPEETSDIVRGGDFFYYIDEPSERTRYFYLNSGLCNFSDEQAAFLIEGMTSVPSGWHIVAASHIWWVYADTSTPTVGSVPANHQKILNLFDAYNNRETGSITVDSVAHAYDFSACEGYVEFCIGGHTHVDYSFTTATGIPVILCCTDSQHLRGSDYSYTAGTTTESAVSAIVADYDAMKISVIRVGRGASSEVAINRIEPVRYTNVLTLAVGTDGQPFQNGKGYAENSRMGSGGLYIGTAEGVDCTGFIPIDPTVDQVIRFKNVTMKTDSAKASWLAIAVWNASFGRLNYLNMANFLASDTGSRFNLVLDGTNITQITFPKSDISSGTKYLAICCDDINDASIITINDPIE